MREAHIDKEVVQMRLVCLHWRLTMRHTQCHHAKRVKDGNTSHSQCKGRDADTIGFQIR